ncbi:hypothetical protein D3C78_1626140 [compost metagenome]
MIDGVDQHGDAKGVAEQDELLAVLGAHLPGLGQEGDCLFPFGLGQLHVLDEAVEVLDQRRHDGAQARVYVTAHACVDGVG